MPEADLVAPVGEHQLLQSDLAALAFFNAHDQAQIDAEFLEHLTRHADLATPAIDQHQIGQTQFGLGDDRGVSGLIRRSRVE